MVSEDSPTATAPDAPATGDPEDGDGETPPATPPVARQHCGFVAVVGAPNAGKSTFVNTAVGARVTIVSRKVQTTRNRVMGIDVRGDSQLVYIDTPGIVPPGDMPARRLERAMVDAAWEALAGVDKILLLVDAASGRINRATRLILDGLAERGLTAVAVLNKIDRIPVNQRGRLLTLADELSQTGVIDDVFMVSAQKARGTEDIVAYLADRMPQQPWHFPADQLSDLPEQMLAAEITREKLFDRLHKELPYAVAVHTEAWEPRPDGGLAIAQVIYVLRQGQKGIVLGRGGEQIKAIGTAARKELEELLGCKIHLELYCKVKPDWVDDPEQYEIAGLNYHA